MLENQVSISLTGYFAVRPEKIYDAWLAHPELANQDYIEQRRPHRLKFVFRGEVAIDIIGLGTGAQLNLTHFVDDNWSEHLDSIQSHWKHILDALAEELEN